MDKCEWMILQSLNDMLKKLSLSIDAENLKEYQLY